MNTNKTAFINILDKLKENPDNPRTIKKDKFDKLKSNIQKLPKMLELRPIVYNKDFIVLGGNMRLRAVKELIAENKLKLKDSYFKNAETLTKAEQKQFIVLDNQEFGDWDFDLLANTFQMDDLLEWGFNNYEFGVDIKEINEKQEWDENEMPEFIADKEITLKCYFKTHKQRESFCINKEIEVTYKQKDQWTARI